jgi:hypothetical protein
MTSGNSEASPLLNGGPMHYQGHSDCPHGCANQAIENPPGYLFLKQGSKYLATKAQADKP